MSGYCDSLPAFYAWTNPVARKQHSCCECAAPILKGEKHFRAHGKWDYGIESFRQHLACCEACMLLRDEFNDGECIGFGMLQETFAELISDNWYRPKDRYKPVWQQLRSLMARIKWRERKTT